MPPGVPDEAAIRYIIEFVRAMVAGADIGESHDVALESIVDDWHEAARGMVLLPGLTNGYRFIIERLNRQDERMARLENGQNAIIDMLERSLSNAGMQRL
jgi:hypothetical protein